jgi:16S rRNA G527 N7-methylase RsmG
MPLTNGYFVAYKSVKAHEEIAEAKSVLKKHRAEVVDVIEYTLPLTENHTRNLVVIRAAKP